MSNSMIANLSFTKRATSAALSAMVLLTTAFSLWMPVALSQEPTMNIARDANDNITVTMDPSMISNVQIKRSNGRMMIELLDEANESGYKIEPILEQASLVKVGSGNRGKVITIDSDEVYLSIQEMQAGAKPVEAPARKKISLSPPPEKKPDTRAAMQKVASKPAPVASKQTTKKASVPVPTATQAAATNSEVAPRTQKRMVQAAEPAMTKPKREETSEIDAVSTAAVDEDNVDSNLDEEDLLNAPAGSETDEELLLLGAEESAMSMDDFETIPLDDIYSEQQQSGFDWGNLIIKMGLSLLAVLALIVVSLKLLLPKMMDRYPAFFNRLKGGSQEEDIQGLGDIYMAPPGPPDKDLRPNTGIYDEDGNDHPVSKKGGLFSGMASKLPMRNKANAERSKGLSKPSEGRPLMPIKGDSNQRAYLEKLSRDYPQFHLLNSSQLEKEKELHVVEIQGHKLVLGSTPYSINLIKELDDTETDTNAVLEEVEYTYSEDDFAPQDNSIKAYIESHPDVDVPQELTSKRRMPQQRPAQSQPQQQSEQEQQPTRRKIIRTSGDRRRNAVLSNRQNRRPEEPQQRQAEPQQRPAQQQPQSRPQQAAPQPSQDEVYKKYLNQPQAGAPQRPAARPSQAGKSAYASNPQAGSPQPPQPQQRSRRQGSGGYYQPSTRSRIDYVDAEDVVILEDYDDTF